MTDDEFSIRLAEMVDRGEVMHVFDVNAEGEADGEPMYGRLTDDFVAMGFGRNRPCVIRYPDGELAIGYRTSFTMDGIEWLKHEHDAGRF